MKFIYKLSENVVGVQSELLVSNCGDAQLCIISYCFRGVLRSAAYAPTM